MSANIQVQLIMMEKVLELNHHAEFNMNGDYLLGNEEQDLSRTCARLCPKVEIYISSKLSDTRPLAHDNEVHVLE
jgi:hypothetical protein